jgi:hypothetical protein
MGNLNVTLIFCGCRLIYSKKAEYWGKNAVMPAQRSIAVKQAIPYDIVPEG